MDIRSEQNHKMTNEQNPATGVAAKIAAAKIVVGVDGSDPSISALRWAAYEALRRNADVLAVSCYSVPIYGSPEGAVYTTPNEDVDMFKDSADVVVARAIAQVAEIDPHLVVDTLTEMSPAAVAISDAARGDDEIVVGATGHGTFMHGLLGSVSLSVVHRSHVPVIVVPVKADVDAGPTMRKIVVGLDGSAESAHALDWAYAEAELSGAELTAVHAWIYPYTGQGEPRMQMQLDAMEELKASLETLGPRLIGGTIHVHPKLIELSPAEALLDEAQDADLVVVGSRGRGALRASLLGSVSRTIVQHATCPVAIIRLPET
jgi:nucleotide-binding universal stress UspA family protein